MKKVSAFIIATAMICVLLSACGGQEPQNTVSSSQDAISQPQDTAIPSGTETTSQTDLDDISHRLLADWYGYTIRCEYLYGDIEWALSNLEPFLEDHTWDNLQIARAALASAYQRTKIVNTKPLEAQMSFDDYSLMLQSGADVGMVQLNVDSIQAITDEILLSYQNYRSYLNSPLDAFFLSYYFSSFENWAHLQRQIYDIYLRDCAVETDYLLLALDNDEEEANFISAIEEQCPQISARRKDNPQDKEELKKLSSELLDEIESLSGKLDSVLGQLRAGFDLEKDASQIDPNSTDALNSYVDSMASDAVELKGFPIALPYPNWWNENETFTYFWNTPVYGENEEGGPRKFLTPGDTVRTPPDQFMAEWTNVPLENYISYIERLEKQYKIPAKYAAEKDGRHTTVYEFPSISFTLTWENDEVSLYVLEGSVCFAPLWYVFHTQRTSS